MELNKRREGRRKMKKESKDKIVKVSIGILILMLLPVFGIILYALYLKTKNKIFLYVLILSGAIWFGISIVLMVSGIRIMF